MAPRKTKTNDPSMLPPVWLEEILKRWDDYFQRFDRMFDFLVKLQETQTSMLNIIKNLENRFSSFAIDHNSAAMYSTLVKFQSDSRTVQEKSCRITWIGVGEKNDDRATAAFDREALKEIIDYSGDQELLAEWQSHNIDIRRFPERRDNLSGDRPRIIKITTRNQEFRDKLLDQMRRGRLSLTRQFTHSYARKDYTREEIEFDRALRKKAGLLNQQEGKLLYVVRDLSIQKLKTPRDLPARSPNSAEAPSLSQALTNPTVYSASTSLSQPSTAHSNSPALSQTLHQRTATQARVNLAAGEQR
ncbi:hypothetical protein Y032_0625g791 [Ancylostoma ceylanicum]|uniref:Uncharacterized protein n=1 Tax=Ancylostoma ceylanicum TaxID=53326 RepID=A0A016WKQ6_9BILA|nr:hypothetical protein Y032_0625g791 [Ancylostoma ceylanicum]